MASPTLSGSLSCIEATLSAPPAPTHPSAAAPTTLRRRANPTQGRALEILGHAIEYLVDSRMFLLENAHSAPDHLAAGILMQASRNVFSECAEILPIRQRLKHWIQAPFTFRTS